jgi:hypothetical protein
MEEQYCFHLEVAVPVLLTKRTHTLAVSLNIRVAVPLQQQSWYIPVRPLKLLKNTEAPNLKVWLITVPPGRREPKCGDEIEM